MIHCADIHIHQETSFPTSTKGKTCDPAHLNVFNMRSATNVFIHRLSSLQCSDLLCLMLEKLSIEDGNKSLRKYRATKKNILEIY